MNSQIINPSAPTHGEEEVLAAQEASKQWWNVEGEGKESFKRKLSEFLGVKHVELVNSGTSANFAALMALTTNYVPEKYRLNQGDEVITTALSFPTTVSPIVYAGAVPVFVDVEPNTWNIDPQQVREMITNKTKVIMVAHAMGNPFNLDAIVDICEEYGLTLIEDNCDCLGADWRGKKTGSIGHIGTSSFYPAHHIAVGEGGAVYTNKKVLHRAIVSMINWGRDCWCPPAQDDTCGIRYGWKNQGDLPEGYDHKNTYSNFGFNFKMTNIQGSIGNVQMDRLPGFVEARRYNFQFLKDLFTRYGEWFELPEKYEGANPSPFGYVIKVTDKAPFKKKDFEWWLDKQGIKSRAFFGGNMTKQPVLATRPRYQFRSHPNLRVSDEVMNNAFWIGVHPGIGEEQRQYMEEKITEFLNGYKV